VIVVGEHVREAVRPVPERDSAVGGETGHDHPAERRTVGERDVRRDAGHRERAKLERDRHGAVLEGHVDAVHAVVEPEPVPAEREVDPSAADDDLVRREGLDVAVPFGAAHEERQARQLRARRGERPDVVRQAEVDEQLDLVAEDAEVVPLLVTAAPAERERRAARVVRPREHARDVRFRCPALQHGSAQRSRSRRPAGRGASGPRAGAAPASGSAVARRMAARCRMKERERDTRPRAT
jgi:hypothetical protein